MFRRLIETSDDVLLASLRVLLGAVMFAHGAQKALGWFGGNGFTGTAQMGIPAACSRSSRLARSSSAGRASRC
jgi:putative oxidoreductase